MYKIIVLKRTSQLMAKRMMERIVQRRKKTQRRRMTTTRKMALRRKMIQRKNKKNLVIKNK